MLKWILRIVYFNLSQRDVFTVLDEVKLLNKRKESEGLSWENQKLQ